MKSRKDGYRFYEKNNRSSYIDISESDPGTVWVGIKDKTILEDIPCTYALGKLTQKQAKQVAKVLNHFADTGKLLDV